MKTYIVETIDGRPLCDGCAENAHDIEREGAPDELTPEETIGVWGTAVVSWEGGEKCDNCHAQLVEPPEPPLDPKEVILRRRRASHGVFS